MESIVNSAVLLCVMCGARGTEAKKRFNNILQGHIASKTWSSILNLDCVGLEFMLLTLYYVVLY